MVNMNGKKNFLRKLILISILFGLTMCLYSNAYAFSGDISGILASQSTVVIDGDAESPKSQALVTKQGTQKKSTGKYIFNILGRLEAIGASEQMIVFTRAYETDESNRKGIRYDDADEEYYRVEYVHIAGLNMSKRTLVLMPLILLHVQSFLKNVSKEFK